MSNDGGKIPPKQPPDQPDRLPPIQPAKPPPHGRPKNRAADGSYSTAGLTATALSASGLLGCLSLFLILEPYKEGKDLGATAGNVLLFGMNFLLLLGVSAISGTLCFSGMIVGATIAEQPGDRFAKLAILLGALGLLVVLGIWIWRYQMVFG